MISFTPGAGRQSARVSRIGYQAPWLQRFLERASGLGFDQAQALEVAALAERKLLDLVSAENQEQRADRWEVEGARDGFEPLPGRPLGRRAGDGGKAWMSSKA
jgi:hypothetical protein